MSAVAATDSLSARSTPSAPAETAPPPSPAGPLDDERPVRLPPRWSEPRAVQTIRFVMRPLVTNLRAQRDLGDVWRFNFLSRNESFVVTCHPDHVASLFKAKPDDAPSLTGESPLRPILGPNSVLTSVGPRHMRQRKLLLPAFHGEAVQRYVQMISDVAESEIDRWPVGKAFPLAPRMQAVTLDVIMGGVFGIGAKPDRGTEEYRMRQTIRRLLLASTWPIYQLIELHNAGRMEPRGVLKALLSILDRQIHAVIRKRRASQGAAGGEAHDVLSMLLAARDEDDQLLTDEELRDELLTLVLAGHETTANSLAWTFERLLRNPAPYDELRERVRAGEDDAFVEATINEGMRVRPVIPMIVRMVNRRWQLGDYVLPARTPVAVSIIALHHRPDVYPEPLAFRPERFLDSKPGTYTWIPFGGGIRRCLGASLAMAEQRVVLRAIAARTDLAATDPAPEHARLRNVTMIPGNGGRVVVQRKV